MGGGTVGIEGSTSAWASVFNLGNCAIGAGILSFPCAFQRTGLFGGVLLCLVVATSELFTLNVLMRQATKHGAITYQGLVHKVLGPRAAELMAWTIFAFLFGSCVAFEIIAGDTFGAVMRHYIIERFDAVPKWLADRRVMILLPALTIMLPLSLLRSMGALAASSSLAVGVMAATTLIIVCKAASAAVGPLPGTATETHGMSWFTLNGSTFAAMPVMIFAYHCHVQAVPIYYELTQSPKLWPPWACRGETILERLPSGPIEPRAMLRKLSGMSAVLAVAVAECTVLYLATGIAGYSLFPDDARSNILQNFGLHDELMQAVQFVVGWAVVLHYPINQHVARSALYDLVCTYTRSPPAVHVPYSHIAGLTCAFFSLTTATACIVSDLGVVFQIIGGVAGSMLIFVLPGALLVCSPHTPGVTCAPGGAPSQSNGEDRRQLNGNSHRAGHRGSASGQNGNGCVPPTSRSVDPRILSSSAVWAARHDGAPLEDEVALLSPPEALVTRAEGSRLHTSWDTPLVGYVLIASGFSVMLVTLSTIFATYLAAQSASGGAQSTARVLLSGASLTHVLTA